MEKNTFPKPLGNSILYVYSFVLDSIAIEAVKKDELYDLVIEEPYDRLQRDFTSTRTYDIDKLESYLKIESMKREDTEMQFSLDKFVFSDMEYTLNMTQKLEKDTYKVIGLEYELNAENVYYPLMQSTGNISAKVNVTLVEKIPRSQVDVQYIPDNMYLGQRWKSSFCTTEISFLFSKIL